MALVQIDVLSVPLFLASVSFVAVVFGFSHASSISLFVHGWHFPFSFASILAVVLVRVVVSVPVFYLLAVL